MVRFAAAALAALLAVTVIDCSGPSQTDNATRITRQSLNKENGAGKR